MNKTLFKNVVTVILAMCVLIMLFSAVSFASEAALADDMISLGSDQEITTLIKWTALSLMCLLVPALVCYCFTYFTKNKVMKICAAALSLLIAVTCIAFFIVVRNLAIVDHSTSVYATASAYFGELLQLALPSLILCAAYTVSAVQDFLKKPTEPAVKEEASDEKI